MTYNLILFSSSHKVGVVEELTNEIDFSNIYILNPFERGRGVLALYLRLLTRGQSKDLFLFLDYRPLIIQVLLGLINRKGHYATFIQHGYFETSGYRNLARRSIDWYINSAYFVFLYIFIGVNDSTSRLRRLKLSFVILSRGSASMLDFTSNKVKWDLAFFYDYTSQAIFRQEFRGSVAKFHVTGTLDKETFRFDHGGEEIYVSQPLHLTGHVSEEEYKAFLSYLFNKNKEMYFLIHPKIPVEWAEDIVDSEMIVKKRDLIDRFLVRKVIGHFSSILLGIDGNIELKIIEKIGNQTLKECEIFSPYQSIDFNSARRIKNIISNNFTNL